MINLKYDPLARYSFGTDKEREIISNRLSIDEIEYIIDYSIEPKYFMDYIYYYGFNIYHVDNYNKFKNRYSFFSDEEIVRVVERILLYNNFNDNYFSKLDRMSKDKIMQYVGIK